MTDSRLTRDGTLGRVYGGDPNLVHVADGQRGTTGVIVSAFASVTIRLLAVQSGARTEEEAKAMLLCPGCYMVVMFNATVQMAKDNDQPLRELAQTMAAAFQRLDDCLARGEDPQLCIEEIQVLLDPN